MQEDSCRPKTQDETNDDLQVPSFWNKGRVSVVLHIPIAWGVPSVYVSFHLVCASTTDPLVWALTTLYVHCRAHSACNTSRAKARLMASYRYNPSLLNPNGS